MIPNSNNNKGTYLGHLRKNFEPGFLRPRLTLSTKGQFAISRQTDVSFIQILNTEKKKNIGVAQIHEMAKLLPDQTPDPWAASQSKEIQVSPCNCGKKPCDTDYQEPSE